MPRSHKALLSTKNLSHSTTPLDMRLISTTTSVLTPSGSPSLMPSSHCSPRPAQSLMRSLTHSLMLATPSPMANAKLMNSKAPSQTVNQRPSATARATSLPAPANTECSSTRAQLSKCSWTKGTEKESPLPAEMTATCTTAHTALSPEAKTECTKTATAPSM